ncbi:MAG: hypothetical protein ACM3KR_01210 [Deltaproteobacteria bacterium]
MEPVGIAFFNKKFIICESLKKARDYSCIYYNQANLNKIFTETVSNMKLKNRDFVITLPTEVVKVSTLIEKTNMRKLKNFDKAIIGELSKELCVDPVENIISYKYYIKNDMPDKMFLNAVFAPKAKIGELVKSLGNVSIKAIDIISESFRRVINYKNDYLILNFYYDGEEEYVGIFIYRNNFLLGYRCLETVSYDVPKLKMEIDRILTFIKSAIKDFSLSRCAIFSDTKGNVEIMLEELQDIKVEGFEVEESIAAAASGLCAWGK